MNEPGARSTEYDLTDGKNRPPSKYLVVDLGHAVARIGRDWFWNNGRGDEPMRWKRTTTLTLLTPADYSENCSQPAASAVAFMDEDQIKALVEALS
jgi:hypothetical protein